MLTDAQKVDVRRYAGWPATADQPATDDSDDAYVYTLRLVTTTLEHRLNNLTAAEETVLTNVYLTNLATLESAIPAMSDDLDTDAAGTWKANPLELGQRFRLFNRWRREMCAFIGVEPGPGLGAGGANIVRA
jgi:hypothetical protein